MPLGRLKKALKVITLLALVLGSLLLALQWKSKPGRDWERFSVNQRTFSPGLELWGESLSRSGAVVVEAGQPMSAVTKALGKPAKVTVQTHFGEEPWDLFHYRVNYNNELVLFGQQGKIKRIYMGPNRPTDGF